ncbi:hypothetical protein FHR47_000291 [Xanthomonas arboricola]|nr:hypothetical protein [Xanthomonas cannabis]
MGGSAGSRSCDPESQAVTRKLARRWRAARACRELQNASAPCVALQSIPSARQCARCNRYDPQHPRGNLAPNASQAVDPTDRSHTTTPLRFPGPRSPGPPVPRSPGARSPVPGPPVPRSPGARSPVPGSRSPVPRSPGPPVPGPRVPGPGSRKKPESRKKEGRASARPPFRGPLVTDQGRPASQSSSEPSLMSANSGVEK